MFRDMIVAALPDLDDGTYDSIAARWPPLQAFFTEYLLPHMGDECIDLFKDYARLRTAFATLEVEVTAQSSKEWMVRQRGLAAWRDGYLLPLARELQLFEHVEDVLLRNCLRRGWICLRLADGQTTELQRQADVIAAVRALLYTFPYPTGKQGHIHLLYTNGLCPTLEAANSVAREWGKRDERAAARARGAVLDVLGSGLLGVLRAAHYPYASIVLELHRLFETTPHLRELPDLVEAHVRRHIIALRWAIDRVDSQLWRADISTQPAKSEARRIYREQLKLDKLQQVAVVLAEILNIDVIDAAGWYDAWMIDGWNELITRSLVALGYAPTMSLEDAQVQQLLDEQVGALDEDARREIAEGVKHFRAAMDETGVQAPLRRLLRDSPYSRSRRNFGRGLWFGMSARSRRGQRSRRKSRDIQRPVKHIELREDDDDNPFSVLAPEDKLVAAYSRRAGLEDDASGRSIVRSVGWNGSVSFLPKDQWQRAVDPTFAEYIKLIKLGHLDGTVWHSALRERVNSLAGTPEWSQQFVRAFYNSIPKRPRWNGGVGEIMAGVSWRATRLRSTRRLFARWLVVVVTMRVPLIDGHNRPLGDECFVVLVIDEATERAMGCWPCPTPPGERELGLALYQSLWHPGIPNWPLRGIPERIRIPAALATYGLTDFRRSMYFLLAEIEVVDGTVWPGSSDPDNDVVEAVEWVGPGVIQRAYGTGPVTCTQVQQALLAWLSSDRWFPHHTIESVPQNWSLALPGFGGPAAGWLLPRTGEVQRVPGGVLDRGVFFQTSRFAGEACEMLWKREFPEYYAGKAAGTFVESSDGDHLYYLTPGALDGSI
jgi:hypothetical protein